MGVGEDTCERGMGVCPGLGWGNVCTMMEGQTPQRMRTCPTPVPGWVQKEFAKSHHRLFYACSH